MLRREGARRREETSALAVGAIQTSGHRHAQTGPTGIVTPDKDGVVGHEGRVLVVRMAPGGTPHGAGGVPWGEGLGTLRA